MPDSNDSIFELWSAHLPKDADWNELPTHVTYRPRAGQMPLSAESVLASQSYVVHEELGRGGFGIVNRAQAPNLRRDVAIKTLRAELARQPEVLRGFIAEALVTGQLEHPHIIPVYDLGADDDGAIYMAMKLVDGRAWSDLLHGSKPLRAIRTGDFYVVSNLEILLHVCNAVAFAHSRQFLHLDLKPANVMVGSYDEVLLMDWGLAVTFADAKPSPLLRSKRELTSPCGTPSYMAPEQARGDSEAIGPWTDTYLLGGILFRILHGQPPHGLGTFSEVVTRAATGQVAPLPDDVPEELVRICGKALDPDPAQRYQTATAFANAVRGFLRHKESLKLYAQGKRKLERLRAAKGSFQAHVEAISLFGIARRFWNDNQKAREAEREAQRALFDRLVERGALPEAGDALVRLERLQLAADKLADCRARLAEGVRSRLAGVEMLLEGLAQLPEGPVRDRERQTLRAERERLAAQLGALAPERRP